MLEIDNYESKHTNPNLWAISFKLKPWNLILRVQAYKPKPSSLCFWTLATEPWYVPALVSHPEIQNLKSSAAKFERSEFHRKLQLKWEKKFDWENSDEENFWSQSADVNCDDTFLIGTHKLGERHSVGLISSAISTFKLQISTARK